MERRNFLEMGLLSVVLQDKFRLLLKGAQVLDPNARMKGAQVIATWNNKMAVETAYKLLNSGKSALDAVEAGARIPEADPEDTSVGYGGFPDRDGNVSLDASIMEGNGNAGSVVFLEGIKHPISVARLVMEKTDHVMLAGEGAAQFAQDQGFKKEILLTEMAKKAWESWKIKAEYKPKINSERHDTIGILALEDSGKMAGACSTSGLAYKMRGRVGDSPIIGSGLYVDNEVGAATATGLGEAVMKKVGAFSIVEMMRQGMSPQKACIEAIKRLKSLPNARTIQVGYIALNKHGEWGAYALRPGFQAALINNDGFKLINADSLWDVPTSD